MGLLLIHLGYSKAASTTISKKILSSFNKFIELKLGHTNRNINKNTIDRIIKDIVKKGSSDYFLNFGLWSALDRYYSEYFLVNLIRKKKDIKFSICIRNQMDWLKSYYLHEISCQKFPRKSNFDDFIKTKLTSGYGNLLYQLNYLEKIKVLKKNIPDRNLKIFIFEKISRKRSNILTDISKFIKRNISSIKIKNEMDINESISGKFMVRLNTFGYFREKYGILPNLRFSNFLIIKFLKKIDLFNRPYQPKYSKQSENLIKDFFSKDNKKLSILLKENLTKLGY